MKSYPFAILTPRECVYEGEILSLVLPTADGEIGFLADREDTVVEIVAGDFRFTDVSGATFVYESDGGIFRITKEGAEALCGVAYRKEEAAEQRQAHAERLEEERKKQEQSLLDYQMTRVALMRAFERLKRSDTKI